jgi:hypothetical protein
MTTQSTINNIFFSWSTNKTTNGFKFVVIRNVPRTTPNKIGNYCDSEIVKTGILPTRARAKSFAQKVVRYCKATA